MKDLVDKLKKGKEIVIEKVKGFSIGDLLLYGGLAIGGITLFELVSAQRPKPPTIPPNYTIIDWENEHGNALYVKMVEPKPGQVIEAGPWTDINWVHEAYELHNRSPFMIPEGTLHVYAQSMEDVKILCNRQRTCEILTAHFPALAPNQRQTVTGTFKWYGRAIPVAVGKTTTVRIFAKAEYAGVEHDLGDLGVIYLEYSLFKEI